jgi:hypothetical protein
MKYLYDEIIESIKWLLINNDEYVSLKDIDLRSVIDGGIYKKISNFRTIFSSKMKDPYRTKQLYNLYNIKLSKNPIKEFERSIITMCSNSKLINIELPPETIPIQFDFNFEQHPTNVKKIYNSVKEMFESFNIETFPFDVSIGTNKNYLIFKRLGPSMCPICNRIHEHENSFVSKYKQDFIFSCYRDISKSITLNL